MSRPKPPEELFVYNIRFTRQQIRKIKENGGPDFLRRLVSKYKKPGNECDAVARLRTIRERNEDIANSGLDTKVLAKKHTLSVKRVQQIRREYNLLNQPTQN
jgi:hypothetical protein